MSPYQTAERRAVQAFAMGVLADPQASAEDRREAHARLLADTRPPDLKRLTTDELYRFREAMHTVRELLARARGAEPPAVPVPPRPMRPVVVTPFAPPMPTREATTLAELLAPLHPPAPTTP